MSADDLTTLVADTLIAVCAMLDRRKLRGRAVKRWKRWAAAWVGQELWALLMPSIEGLYRYRQCVVLATDYAKRAAGGARLIMGEESAAFGVTQASVEEDCRTALRYALADLRPDLRGSA
jgi:hypothetical protein